MNGTALITGGSRGLGFELSRALIEAGWTVVVDGRDPDDLAAATARALRHRGRWSPWPVTSPIPSTASAS